MQVAEDNLCGAAVPAEGPLAWWLVATSVLDHCRGWVDGFFFVVPGDVKFILTFRKFCPVQKKGASVCVSASGSLVLIRREKNASGALSNTSQEHLLDASHRAGVSPARALRSLRNKEAGASRSSPPPTRRGYGCIRL